MSDRQAQPTVTVYWRPGCPFCASLRWRLRQLGVATTEVDIWKDRDAAALVRAVANGNETVPTVIVGGEALVNPAGAKVLEAVRRLAPDAEGSPAPRSNGRRTRWLRARLRRWWP